MPVLIRHRGAQHRAAVVNSDRRPRLPPSRSGPASHHYQPAAGQRPGVLRHIIRHLQVADRRHGGVHREHKVRRVAAGVPATSVTVVLRRCSLAQRIRSEAPVPVLIRHRGAQHRAAVVNSDRRPASAVPLRASVASLSARRWSAARCAAPHHPSPAGR